MTAVSSQEARLRILIVAHTFPPMNAIGSHRPYSWAREWRDAGHEVHVLTPTKYGFDGNMDLDRDLAGIAVHEVTYLPIRQARFAPAEEGNELRARRWEWFRSATRRVRFGLGMFGDLRLLAYLPMVHKGLEVARERPFHFIIATSPPEVAFLVARTLSRRTGAPWVADFRDAWFHDLRLHHLALVSSLSARLQRRLVADALAVVTVSSGLQKRLADYLGCEVFRIYNGFMASDRDSNPGRRPWGDEKIHVCYTGRVYPGKQDPTPLFRALARLRGVRPDLAQRLVVDFYGYDGSALEPVIREHGVGDCVVLRGFVAYRESIGIQCAADALLFLDWTDDRGEGMLTGKLLEYLGSGRPVLALGSRGDSEAAQLIFEMGAGQTLTSVEQIVSFLGGLLDLPRAPTMAGPEREVLSREHQARMLLERIRSRLP